MNEEIAVLQSIYSRPNELIYDDQLETVQYNGKNYSVTIYLRTGSVMIDSGKFSAEELKELRSHARLTTTIYDLLTDLESLSQKLIGQREEKRDGRSDERTMMSLFQIDHMRSPTIYLKHLKQWTKEENLTGRVLIVGSHQIYLLIEGSSENVKKFLVKLKTENVDIDSRGRPCKERLLSEIVSIVDQPAKFDDFQKIEFVNRIELKTYLKTFHYEHLFDDA